MNYETLTRAAAMETEIEMETETENAGHFTQAATTTLTTAVNYTHSQLHNNINENINTQIVDIGSGKTLTNDSLIMHFKNDTKALITAIRANVTSILNVYFQNTTSEFNYTPTTITNSTTESATATTAPTTIIAPQNLTVNQIDDGHHQHHHQLSNINSLNENATTALTQLSMATMKSSSIAITTTATINSTATNATATMASAAITTNTPSITFLSYPISIDNYENCSAIFADYAHPNKGTFCNWTWDQYLCWPPTPAGVLARMHCPSGWLTVDARKFAIRKCELDGHWGGRPNDTHNPHGWTDFKPCFKPEVNELFRKLKNPEVFVEIAVRTRTLEIVGLVLSLFALILSLTIFCNFRSLRNNRTKIHKNLFIAMILQVIVRLTLYLDQAYRRDKTETTRNSNMPGIENTPYLCEASYILLEYARSAMFMWMWIEGFYLHNMVATLAVFHSGFPHTIFSLIGWFFPFLITLVWAICTALYMDSTGYCWWNYNLTSYYWILEGPRSLVILLNFFFLINIIRVLVVKLRESQASDVEQTRKAVKAAIVLLPLLGITNLLYLVPTFDTPWKFALWSYITHFLTSFQGFFIALIYCFLNGEVRAVLLKSLAVYMSVRGHPEWVPKQASMFSGAYNTAPDTEAAAEGRRHTDGQSSTPTQKQRRSGSIHHNSVKMNNSKKKKSINNNNSNKNKNRASERSNWLITLCFRGQKNECVMSSKELPQHIYLTTRNNINTLA